MLRTELDLVETLEKSITKLEARIDEVLLPFAGKEAELLVSMPGISHMAARVVIAEIGKDMSQFPTAGHLVSWAGLCPRSDESAGKKRSTKIRKGNAWLKTTLVQCAWAAIRNNGYLKAKYHRVRAKAGKMKAIIAVAREMLVAIYHMISKRQTYKDLGADYFEKRDRLRLLSKLTRRIERLGFEVQLTPLATVEPAASG